MKHSSIVWSQALSAVGIMPKSAALPYSGHCPSLSCSTAKRDTFTLYRDVRFGAWYHCAHCGSAGTMIDLPVLCGKANNRKEALTVYQKAQLPVPMDTKSVNEMLALHSTPDVINDFFLDCSTNLAEQSTYGKARMLLDEYGIRPTAAWNDVLANSLGMVSRDNLNNMLRELTGYQYSKATAAFKSRRWRDGLIIPFYDLPGRIGSLLCLGDNGNWQDQEQAHVVINEADPGIAFYDPDQVYADTVFVFLDPLIALWSHEHHSRLHKDKLPIVARLRDNHEPCRIFEQVYGDKKLVVWDYQLSNDLFRHAKRMNAYIATSVGANVLERFKKQWPSEWLEQLKRTAAPWPNVLEEYLSKKAPIEVEATIRGIDFLDHEYRTFANNCSPELQRLLEAIEKRGAVHKTVKINSQLVSETAGGWMYRDELVSDAMLHIDRIICQDTGRLYEGKVVYKAEEVPFCESADVVEDNAFRFMRNLVIDAGKGVPAYNPKWNKYVTTIASQLHPPQIVKSSGRIGWDQEKLRFAFDGFSVYPGPRGVVYDNQLPSSVDVPGHGVKCEVETFDWFMGEKHDKELAWAFLGAIVYNLIAPAINLSPMGIACSNSQAATLCPIVTTGLGCLESSSRGHARTNKIENPHGWPVMKRQRGSNYSLTGLTAAWAKHEIPHNCFICLNYYASRVCAIQNSWIILEGRKTGGAGTVHPSAKNIVVAYIAHLAAKHLSFPMTETRPIINSLMLDMAEWVGQTDEDAAYLVGNSLSYIKTAFDPYETTARFGEILASMFCTGEVSFYRAGFDRQRDVGLVYLSDPDRIFIPKALINRKLVELGAPTMDTERVACELASQQLLLEEGKYRKETGWYVPEKWWNEQLVNQKGQNSKVLRIAR